MSTNIQQARDVLAKRDRSEWAVSYDEDFDNWEVVEVRRQFEGGFVHGRTIAVFERYEDAQRVALTTGNPDLLDTIDGLLAHGQFATTNPMNEFGVRDWAERIAAAIITANDRMTS
jgi:hypothetical protein